MLSISKPLLKRSAKLTSLINNRSSLRAFGSLDKSGHHYTQATFDPAIEVREHTPIVRNDDAARYNITTLDNGFNIVTESTVFPGPANLAFLIDLGTRDETKETSGSCLALSSIFRSSLKDNYRNIQRTGGSVNLEYDQERTFYFGQCLEYDASDVLDFILKPVTKTISETDAQEALNKFMQNHEMNEQMQMADPFMSNTEHLIRTAYGENGLGMPRLGLKEAAGNINAKNLQKFITDTITPSKCVIAANNVNNHDEFVELCKEKIGSHVLKSDCKNQRKTNVYLGGDYKEASELPVCNIVVSYESCSWTSDKTPAFFVMNTLIGSAQAFSVGGPGKGMYCRAITNLMQRYAFVDGAGAVNNIFTDTGIFGMNIEGPATHAKDLSFLALQELHRLREPIPIEELERAKNILKMNILQSLERDEDRLEEMAKNYMTFGKITFNNYLENIDKVTSEQINSIAIEMLRTKPTIVATGGGVEPVPTAEEVITMLNG